MIMVRAVANRELFFANLIESKPLKNLPQRRLNETPSLKALAKPIVNAKAG